MPEGLTVGQLARAANVTSSTVRYYERLGILPPALRASNGYRIFPAQAVRRLTVIRAAQEFGFPLRQLTDVFRERDRGGIPCRSVREAGQRLVVSLNDEIAALQAKRRQMRRVLAEWDQILARTPDNCAAHLLEMLTPAAGHTRRSIRRGPHR